MSTGVILAWATEALEKKIISVNDTLVELKWGNWQNYIKAVKYIVEQPNEFYRTLALGVEEASKKYGGSEFALAFGGNEMPGYHAGAATHIGYLIGARHSHLDNAGYSYDQKLIGKEYPTPEKVIDDLVNEESWRQILSSLVVCFFARGIYKPELVAKALEPLGYNYTVEEIIDLGKKMYSEKYRLKIELGFDITKARIPERILETPTPHGHISREFIEKALKYFNEKINKMIKEYT